MRRPISRKHEMHILADGPIWDFLHLTTTNQANGVLPKVL